MDNECRQNIIAICEQKIALKGDKVGLSLYAFFKNKNDDPVGLMAVAQWWIMVHKLDHFENALKIKKMVSEGL
jgi:hypothetical protein